MKSYKDVWLPAGGGFAPVHDCLPGGRQAALCIFSRETQTISPACVSNRSAPCNLFGKCSEIWSGEKTLHVRFNIVQEMRYL